MPEVSIECIEQQGQRLWVVRLGRRTLSFRDENAARAFAAQLHMRRDWLLQAQPGAGKTS
ncbi:hypothetical protein [Pseudomonas sp. NCCP-436]|uniref:hypothetical protein n=1 Tax=Pseudomonas sp. NCCP-436 TaxID=2842481 RepID=UPI001C7E5C1B|nr:hypothetical protein [Pseudomonas sp. NCCP-436]GIZ11901.1 hypothetical protein NCCP436_13170 [Pseudomonas sp. NCCP-436]